MVKISFIYEHKVYDKIYDKKELTFNKALIYFESKINHDINDLFFLHKGKNLLKNKSKLISKDIKIMIFNTKSRKDNNKINYNYVTCPECKKLSYINIKDNMISINCVNNHNINFTFKEFINNHKIEDYKINCDHCGNNRTLYEKFYFCSCNKNICSLCSEFHIKKHNILDYNKKFIFCRKHNNPFISYCLNVIKIYTIDAKKTIVNIKGFYIKK